MASSTQPTNCVGWGRVTSAALRYRAFIPVTIDAVREIETIGMVRVTYFALTSDAPAAVWEVELPPLVQLHGVGALGSAGVVYSAMRESDQVGGEAVEFDLFERPEDVAAIFSLEDDSPLTVQIEDVWMPVSWFHDVAVWGDEDNPRPVDWDLERGQVYRVDLPLFQEAYRYTAGEIGFERLAAIDPQGQVLVSPVEGEAMRGWSQDQIDATRAAFPEKEVKLRYREESSA